MDFTYDSDDLATVKASYTDFTRAQNKGVLLGNITFLALFYKTGFSN